MGPKKGSVRLTGFEHVVPGMEWMRGGMVSPFRATDSEHRFDLSIAVVGDENAALVKAMLRRWLGDMGAEAPDDAPRPLIAERTNT